MRLSDNNCVDFRVSLFCARQIHWRRSFHPRAANKRRTSYRAPRAAGEKGPRRPSNNNSSLYVIRTLNNNNKYKNTQHAFYHYVTVHFFFFFFFHFLFFSARKENHGEHDLAAAHRPCRNFQKHAGRALPLRPGQPNGFFFLFHYCFYRFRKRGRTQVKFSYHTKIIALKALRWYIYHRPTTTGCYTGKLMIIFVRYFTAGPNENANVQYLNNNRFEFKIYYMIFVVETLSQLFFFLIFILHWRPPSGSSPESSLVIQKRFLEPCWNETESSTFLYVSF